MEKRNPRVLIIGLTWPEPQATAAGVRILQIIRFLSSQGYAITFSSAAAIPSDRKVPHIPGVAFEPIRLNHESFDQFLSDLDPGMVIFDRFLTEEYFGWRVARITPGSLRILDTEDLHSLRRSREIALKKGIPFQPSLWRGQDITKRELASIYRSDLSLIISRFEMEWLRAQTPLDPSLLCYLPFFFQEKEMIPETGRPSFEVRKNFVFIGNGRHAPNIDAIFYLKEEIWPKIRKQLPDAQVEIYGAHLNKKTSALTAPEQGYFVKGWTPDASEIMRRARVNLIPLRFGAGLKGKLFQAALCGTPSVMTSVAAEGTAFAEEEKLIGDDPGLFASRAVSLYLNKELWEGFQRKSHAILKADFMDAKFFHNFQSAIHLLSNNLQERREKNIIGGMLLHHTTAGGEYLSRWIRLKEERADKHP